MSAATKQKPPSTIDAAKLESMVEPLTVTVDKIKGNTRTNIPLPVGDDGQSAPGTNWSKDDLRNIQSWLVTSWAGGGYYEITVTDDSKPQPLTMKWTTYYDPNTYPERVPPPLQGGTPSMPANVPPPLPRGPAVTAFPNGLPPNPFPMQAPATPAAGPMTPYYPVPTAYYPPYQQQPQGYGNDPRLAVMEAQLRESTAMLQRERENAQATRYQAELAAQREASRAESARLENKIAELAGLVARVLEGGGPNRTDPQTEVMREQIRQQAEENRRLAEKAENDRRERELRDLMRAQAEATQRQIETMQANFNQLMAATRDRAHDPLISMFQEQQRSQVEAMKEVARSNQVSMERLQNIMMNPRDVISMMKDASQGVDVVANQVTRAFTNVIDVQGRLMEQIGSLQGGGDSPVTLIKDGVERASGMFQEWIKGKSKEAIATSQAQAQVARAQADAMGAQVAAAQLSLAQVPHPTATMPPPPVPTPVPVPQQPRPNHIHGQQGSGGLAGSNGNGLIVEAVPTDPNKITVVQRPQQQPITLVPQNATNNLNANNVPRRLGRTDAEWFGPLVGKVNELRAGVARAIESAGMNPPRLDKATHKIDGIEPDQAAHYLMQATGMVMQQQIVIAAIMDLLLQERFADFIDVVLPDAPDGYKHKVIQSLVAELKAAESGADDDDDDDEDDEDDEDDGDDRKNDGRAQRATPPAQA